MLSYVMGFNFDLRAKPPVVNLIWQIMAACSCNASIQQVKLNLTCKCTSLCPWWNYNYFGCL